MDTRVVRVLLCCLVLAWGFGVAAGPVLAASDTASGSDGVDLAADPVEAASAVQEIDEDDEDDDQPSLGGFDEVHVEIDLSDNGSAAWTMEYRYRLDGENATEDWEALHDDVENRSGEHILMFRDRNSGLVSDAENATERNMSTSNFTVETDESSSPQDYGYVRFTFEWSAFAHVEVNRIEAGEALTSFTMDERTQLVISWPEEYENVTIEPEADDRGENSVIWYGDETREFVEDEPYIELIRTGGEPLDTPEEEEEGMPLSWALGAGALVVVLGAAGVVAWSRTRTDEGGEAPAAGPAPPPAEPDDGSEEEVADEPAAPPAELLSNEERVLGLLEERGGRIKQQKVVAELDWTEAKTSQVVSGLREDGEIEVFRIGRENVLALDNGAEATDGASDGGAGGVGDGADAGGPDGN